MQVTTADLVAYILRKCRSAVHAVNSPVLVAITGPSCSGKSLLARQLALRARGLGFEVTLHHLTDHQARLDEWPDPGQEAAAYYNGAFDLPRFVDEVHRVMAGRRDETAGFVIAEGEFLLAEKFRTLWDFSVWLEADDDLLVRRALSRDLAAVGPAGLNRRRSIPDVERVYREMCLPANALHKRLDRPQDFASMVVKSSEDGWVLHDEALRAERRPSAGQDGE